MVVNDLQTAEQLKGFIRQKAVSPLTVRTQGGATTRLDTGGGAEGGPDGKVSQEEITAYFGSDQVSISTAAWQDVAGEDELFSVDEYIALATEEETLVEGNVATPGETKPSAEDVYLAYLQGTGNTRKFIPQGEIATVELLQSLGADGITQKEFERIFGIKMTNAAWMALTGKEADETVSLTELRQKLMDYRDVLEGTGQSFRLFCTLRKFTYLTSGATCVDVYKNMSTNERLEFVRQHRSAMSYETYVTDAEIMIDLDRGLDPINKREAATLRRTLLRISYSMAEEMDRENNRRIPSLHEPLAEQLFAQQSLRSYMISGTLAGRDVTAEAAHQNAVLKQARKLLGEAEAGRWLAAIDLNSREDESTISAAQRVNAACQRIAAAIDEIEQILADEKLDDAAKKAAILTALSTSLERGIATPNP